MSKNVKYTLYGHYDHRRQRSSITLHIGSWLYPLENEVIHAHGILSPEEYSWLNGYWGALPLYQDSRNHAITLYAHSQNFLFDTKVNTYEFIGNLYRHRDGNWYNQLIKVK